MSVDRADPAAATAPSTVALHWVAGATRRWETTGTDRLPIELAAGTRQIDIEWSQRKNTRSTWAAPRPRRARPPRTTTPARARSPNVHKAFSGSRPLSGPLKEVRVDVGGITNVNNVPRCAANQTARQSVVVRVGLAGRLELTPPTSPPVALRISASGPEVLQTQQLNCMSRATT